MNNKVKGFTLIELLAVIVILAIIAIIVTPIVTGIINKSKDCADLRSAEADVTSADDYFEVSKSVNSRLNVNVIDKLELSNKKAEKGSSVIVGSNGKVDLAIIIRDKCYRKTGSQSISDIEVTTDLDVCNRANIDNYAILVGYKNIDTNHGSKSDLYFLGSTQLKNKYVTTVTKADTLPSNCTYTWEAQDTDILNNTVINACAVGSDATGYAVTLMSSKDIMAPKDATLLFYDLGSGGYTFKYTNSYSDTPSIKPTFLVLNNNISSSNRINFILKEVYYHYNPYILNLDWLNTSYTENMSYMFSYTGDIAMTSLNLGDKFDTSNVTDMHSMFDWTGAEAMTSLNLGDKFDTSKVTDMSSMFDITGVAKMQVLNLGDKFDTSNVTNMSNMFSYTGDIAMTSLNLGDKFDTSNVTNMSNMFYETGAEAMTSLNLGDKFDTSKVTDMSYMFENIGAEAMTTLDLGSAFKNISFDYNNMFYNTGASGCKIKVSNEIYLDATHFKLDKDSSETIEYTKGTIVSTY